MELHLYYAPNSCAFAALVALEEAGAVYVPKMLDLAAGDQRTPEYRAINSLGRVPSLVVDGEPITELLAVLTFIANQFKGARLLTLDEPILLAKSYELMSWFSTSIHAYVLQILRGERLSDDARVRELLKEPARRYLMEELRRLDRRYVGRFLIDDRFTVVDAFSFVIWRWAQRLGIDTSGLVHWANSVAYVSTIASVRRALAVEVQTQPWLSIRQAD